MRTLFERVREKVMNNSHTIREREKFKLFENIILRGNKCCVSMTVNCSFKCKGRVAMATLASIQGNNKPYCCNLYSMFEPD